MIPGYLPTNEMLNLDQMNQSGRGASVYTLTELLNISGYAKNGDRVSGEVQIPVFI